MNLQTVKNHQLAYLTAENIAAPHCFTTRLGGVSEGHLSSLNIGMHRGDRVEAVLENHRRLASALGFDTQNLVLTHQIHTDLVRCVTKRDALGADHHLYPQCDALITRDPGTALMIFTADCTPVLLWDRKTGAVGAAHAGWRGTALDIAGKTVAQMTAQFGCDPADLCAAIGPNIGPCCFETDEEVPRAMTALLQDAANAHIRKQGDKYYVNLKAINALLLQRAGVRSIAVSEHCTMCRPDLYWSHRYTRGVRGSQGAIIVCKEVQP